MNQRERAGAKKQKKSRLRDDDDASAMMDDEAAAQVSESLSSRNADGEEMSPEEQQDALVEQLAEKRASTRQAALTKLISSLQLSVQYDFLTSRLETLQMYLLNSVRKGDTPETALACRALKMVALTLGADSEALLQAATPIMREYLKNTSKSATGRAAVAEALGFLGFIGCLTPQDTQQAMALFTDALATSSAGVAVPESVATACWEAWGLLASTLPTSTLGGTVLEAHLPTLVRFLDDESGDVRTAAGENIALLVEAQQTLEAERAENGEDEEDEEAAGSSSAAAASPSTDELNAQMAQADLSPKAGGKKKRSFAQTKSSASAAAASSSSSLGDDRASLISKLSSLAKDSSRRVAKKERATQRKSFRDILRTVEDGDVPEESLKIEKSRHSFSGWPHAMQLAAVRDVVSTGLNTHMVHNDVLADIFALQIESGEGVDAPGRKAQSRAQSKAKALENFVSREKGRKKKQAMTNPHAQDD